MSYTPETCEIESRKYKTRGEFYRNNRIAYNYAYKHNLMSKFTWLKRERRIPRKLTKSLCIEESKKYKTFGEFESKDHSAYQRALEMGWLKECIWLRRNTHNQNYWTFERCIDVAKECISMHDLQIKYAGAYNAIMTNHWDIKQYINRHHTFIEKQNNYEVYSYIDEINKFAYIGITRQTLKIRHKQHQQKNKQNITRNGYDVVYYHFITHNLIFPYPNLLESNLCQIDAKIKENEYIEKYASDGYKILNIAKSGEKSSSTGGYPLKWDKENVIKEGEKYLSKTDFARKNASAYRAALAGNYLNEIKFKMKTNRKPNGYYSKERCIELSKKFIHPGEFQKKEPSAYAVSRYKGWLKEFTWLTYIKTI